MGAAGALGLLLPAASGAPAAAVAAATTTATAAPEAVAYWGSFLAEDGAWSFAPVGPSARTAEDGSVEGWRFATAAAGARPRPPRGLASFEDLCGEVPAADGRVRVGVVLDYGRPVDAPPGAQGEPPAPRGACAQVPEGSSGEVVLDEVATLRAEAGVLCAVDGYPAEVCQPEVPLPDAARAADQPVEIAVGAPAPASAGPVQDAPAAEAGEDLLAGPVGLVGALVVALALAAGLAAGGLALLRRVRGRPR
ncbi:SCO2322 family protein [uncultured Pseudokineococcus sp.]|uniref:SCO2322 family protein n=1 Tax=uncultured Pseudokineococcus sp. TaxID=1642928 RepID=UPI0026290964|nr:SCO2322 family protein [uncultured Pseudokineococcus sp.]